MAMVVAAMGGHRPFPAFSSLRLFCVRHPQGEKSVGLEKLVPKGSSIELPYMGQGLVDLHTDEICIHIRRFLDN
ncbi:MAG: hypothetical protein ACKVKT_05245 [Rhodospirillales bacterium]|jgi:hypothetical protein